MKRGRGGFFDVFMFQVGKTASVPTEEFCLGLQLGLKDSHAQLSREGRFHWQVFHFYLLIGQVTIYNFKIKLSNLDKLITALAKQNLRVG